MGIFLVRNAPLYIDRPYNMLADPYDVNSVNMMGRNNSVFEVVSSMMTARQYVMRVAPLRTAAAPRIAMVSGFMQAWE